MFVILCNHIASSPGETLTTPLTTIPPTNLTCIAQGLWDNRTVFHVHVEWDKLHPNEAGGNFSESGPVPLKMGRLDSLYFSHEEVLEYPEPPLKLALTYSLKYWRGIKFGRL